MVYVVQGAGKVCRSCGSVQKDRYMIMVENLMCRTEEVCLCSGCAKRLSKELNDALLSTIRKAVSAV